MPIDPRTVQWDEPAKDKPPLDAIVWDDAPKPAAAKQPATPPGPPGYFGRMAEGADLAATGASGLLVGALEPVVGVGSRVLGRDYRKDKQDFRDTFQYQPQTQGARDTIQAANDFMAPITKPVGEAAGSALNYLDEAIGKYAGKDVQKYAREFVGAGSDVVGAMPAVGTAAKAVSSAVTVAAERAAAKAALAKVARRPDEVAKALGLRIAPESVQMATGTATKPSLTARSAEAIAGDDVALYNQRYNKAAVNNVAVEEIGLPRGTLITDDAMRIAAKPHVDTYEAVRKAIPVEPVDDEFLRAVASAGKRKDSALRLPSTVGAKQEDILIPMNGGKMIDTISDLRNGGWADFLSDGAEAKARGAAQLELADALEARLDRAIAKHAPELAGKYQEARRGFAQINAVEKARVGYDIDPRKLVRMAEKSNALDGGLRAIADVATAFPRDFDITPRVPSTTGSWSLGSVVSPVRAGVGKAVSVSRGSQPARLGMDGPLSYYYRGDGETGLPARAPMKQKLLTREIRLPEERSMGQPSDGPPLALPAPGRTSAPNPNAAFRGDELGYSPDVASAGTRHPGGTPLSGHPEPMALADSLEAYIANQKGDGINFENVLIEPTKRRTYPTVAGKRQRGIKQGEKVGNKENMRAAPGAEERGMALELALQGKKVPKDKNTYRAREIKKEKR